MTNAEKLLRAYLGIPEGTPIHPTHTLSWVAALDAMNRLMENISNNNQQQKESEHNNNTIAKEYTLDDAKNEVALAAGFQSWKDYVIGKMIASQFSKYQCLHVMDKVAQLYADKKVKERMNLIFPKYSSLNGYTFTNEFNNEIEVIMHDEGSKWCLVQEDGKKKPYLLPVDFVLAIKKESEENKID